MARTTPMRIEPKTFFANERTFLSWLHMAVTIGSIAAALLGFAGIADSSKKLRPQVCAPSLPLHLQLFAKLQTCRYMCRLSAMHIGLRPAALCYQFPSFHSLFWPWAWVSAFFSHRRKSAVSIKTHCAE